MSKALTVLKRQIREGEFDDELDDLTTQIYQTVARRKQRMRDELLDKFTTGMRVRTLPGNYKPRYFANRVGTITRIEDGTVWIELDTPILRSRGTIQNIGMRGVEYLEILDDSPVRHVLL